MYKINSMKELVFNEFSMAWGFTDNEQGQRELHIFFVKGYGSYDDQVDSDKAVFGDIGIKGYKKVVTNIDESKFGSADALLMYIEIYNFATKDISSPWSIIQPRPRLDAEELIEQDELLA